MGVFQDSEWEKKPKKKRKSRSGEGGELENREAKAKG